MRVVEVELSRPLPVIRAGSSSLGIPYLAARVLVRLHTRPIGILDVALPEGSLPACELAEGIEREFGERLREHVAEDALGGARADEHVLADGVELPCLLARAALLADAPPATVIIPTRGRAELVQAAIEAVKASEYPAERLRLIVVDNVPTDQLTERAVTRAARSDPRVSYMRCDTPGSSSARNAGIEAADSELVAMIDDDVTVDRHWLAELVLALSTNRSLACVTGGILPAQLESRAQVLMERFGGYHKGFHPRTWCRARPPADEPLFPYTCGRFGSGNSVAYRRSVIRAIGGYDPVLGNGTAARAGEDIEVFLRLLRAGHSLGYQPSALAWHLHRRDIADLRNLITDYGRGLSAALTRTVLTDPAAAIEIARRLPGGVRYLLAPNSPKNAHHDEGYPIALRVRELYGLAHGPVGYLRSRRAAAAAVKAA